MVGLSDGRGDGRSWTLPSGITILSRGGGVVDIVFPANPIGLRLTGSEDEVAEFAAVVATIADQTVRATTIADQTVRRR